MATVCFRKEDTDFIAFCLSSTIYRIFGYWTGEDRLRTQVSSIVSSLGEDKMILK